MDEKEAALNPEEIREGLRGIILTIMEHRNCVMSFNQIHEALCMLYLARTGKVLALDVSVVEDVVVSLIQDGYVSSSPDVIPGDPIPNQRGDIVNGR